MMTADVLATLAFGEPFGMVEQETVRASVLGAFGLANTL